MAGMMRVRSCVILSARELPAEHNLQRAQYFVIVPHVQDQEFSFLVKMDH